MKKAIIATLIAGAMSSANAFDLKILHINDHHSHIEANGRMDLTLAGEKTRVTSGGMARLATLFAESAKTGNVLKLHAGDAITGTVYYTLNKGESDAEVMNAICFDAFVVGNHEFDGGDAGLKKFLDDLNKGNCATPTLGANVKPEAGVSPLLPQDGTAYLKPYVIKEVGGEKVGIVGIVIANKTKNSSSPDETTMFLDEIETAQKYIDELKGKGVKKIVLLTHNQYGREVAMAAKLTDVDVIVGGDSHTLLGEKFKNYGLNPKGKYPTITQNKDGNTTCVVQAWQYAAIFGELNVKFNGDDVESCTGMPVMPLADSFKRKNDDGDRVELEGAEREAVKKAVEDSAMFAIVEEDADMKAIVDKYKTAADELKSQKIATATEDLCLERIPGQGYRNCDKAANQPSEISVVVAEAFRRQSKLADFAIQNAGGVRENVTAGDFTTGNAYELLPFANTLAELTMTGQEVKDVLEEALDYAYNGSTGAYPYGAGIRFDVNGAKMKGYRISGIEVQDKKTRDWAPLALGNTYTVVTNNYIAGGKDGYVTFGKIAKDSSKYVDTYLDYAQSFVDYVKEKETFGKLPADEHSTKSYTSIYTAGQNVSGIWWDPKQGGHGVTIKDGLDGARVSGAVYTYDDKGMPVWYLVNLDWMATTGDSTTPMAKGDIDMCTGTPKGQDWDASLNKCNKAGTATLVKNGDEKVKLTLEMTGGDEKSFDLVPFVLPKGKRAKYDNMYWDKTKSGQGVYLAMSMAGEKNSYVGAWYSYDAEGKGTWYYLDGKKADGDKWMVNYDVLMVTMKDGKQVNKKVGTASFEPKNVRSGEFKYTMGDKSGMLNLEGFDFN